MIDRADKLTREGFTLATRTLTHTSGGGAVLVAKPEPTRVYLEVSCSNSALWFVGWTHDEDPGTTALAIHVPNTGVLCWKYSDVGNLVQQSLYGKDTSGMGTVLFVTEVLSVPANTIRTRRPTTIDTSQESTRRIQAARMGDIRDVVSRIRNSPPRFNRRP